MRGDYHRCPEWTEFFFSWAGSHAGLAPCCDKPQVLPAAIQGVTIQVLDELTLLGTRQ